VGGDTNDGAKKWKRDNVGQSSRLWRVEECLVDQCVTHYEWTSAKEADFTAIEWWKGLAFWFLNGQWDGIIVCGGEKEGPKDSNGRKGSPRP